MNKRIQAAALLFLGSVLCCPLAGRAPIGWRQDGTGRFPKARPPLEWSKDKNVLWKTRMPGQSFGSPVVMGSSIFVASDPAELLCVRASDGKILWQQSNTTALVYGKEKAAEIAEQFDKLEKERNNIGREENKLRKEQPDNKEKLDQLRQKRREADQAIQALEKKVPRKEQRGGAGNSAATPVSDGKHVAAVFGNGVVGAYTTEGKRLWVKFIESAFIGFGPSSSPVLLGEKLIVHLKDLIALDVLTGKELWRIPLPATHASPLVARLGKEDVLIAASGAVVRVRDGKVLAKGKFNTSEATPVLQDGVLYVTGSGTVQAFKLSQTGEDLVVVEPLWKGTVSRKRRTPSSVSHDGLLYGANTAGILDVTDLKTGELVYKQRLPLNTVYASITLAGEYLYVLDLRGKTVVLKAGRRYERVAMNQLEGTGACPVFVEDRLYLRGQQHLYCLAAKGENPQKEEQK